MRLEAALLKSQIANQFNVLYSLSPLSRDAINLSPRHVPCPIHGGKDGFRIYQKRNGDIQGVCNTCHGSWSHDIFGLLQFLNNWSFVQALKEVDLFLNGGKGEVVNAPRSTPKEPQPDKRKQQFIDRLWCSAYSQHELTKAYLANRGLTRIEIIPDAIRGKDYVSCWDAGERSNHPAMISKITGADGRHLSNHITYLDDSGHKAKLSSPKKIMSPALAGSLVGGAVRLYTPAATLCLAEGIETALAVYSATGLPVWACLTAGLLEAVVVPDYVRRVHIMADKDRSERGRMAATTLESRLTQENRAVRIHLPPAIIPERAKSVDWLDFYREVLTA